MAKRRVIAHFMHEEEAVAARGLLDDPEVTDAFAIGEVEEADIPRLREAGLVVDVLDHGSDPGVALPGLPQPGPADRRRTRSARGRDRSATGRPGYHVLQLAGPLTPARRAALRGNDIELLECVAPSRSLYSAYLTGAQRSVAESLPFVLGIRPWSATDPDPTADERSARRSPSTGVGRMLSLDLRLHRVEDAPALLAWLDERSVTVAGVRDRKVRVHVLEGSLVAQQVATRPEVQSAEEFVPPSLHNDRARALLGIDPAPGADPVLPLTGAGEIVAVADTGIDDAHPDFGSRIEEAVGLGRVGDPSDPNGHGTHVCGSIAGDGAASGGDIRGTAPGARLYVQSVMDEDGELGGLPWDLNDLFGPPYEAGARIHNNSWGADTRSRYTFSSIEADEFVHDHRDMLLVISAGNEGVDRESANTAEGFVDWLSIGSPASSKNGLTVGASRTDRTEGGFSELSNRDAWPADFPHAPEAGETVSGDPEEIAAFSSHGPCDDRRIKPDLVAPGTDIVSARSSIAPLRKFWGSFPGHDGRYAYNGGTSMAAPLVSGCAALVREYYRTERGHEEPSAALVKASLINGTRWLAGRSATAEFEQAPNFHQGFGCLHMPWVLPNDGAPGMQLAFLDTWDDTDRQLAAPGSRLRFDLEVDDGEFLRFCLAWTDLPARALQNNLNLFVEEAATGTKWVGNQDLPLSLGVPDPENNVEVVRIEGPSAGTYRVQITATNLLGEFAQDFALVATGPLASDWLPV